MRMLRAITRFTADEGSYKRGDVFRVESDERAAYLIGIHVAEDYGPAPDANKAYEPHEKKVTQPDSDTGELEETGKAKPSASSVAVHRSTKPKSGKRAGKK